MRRLTRSEIGMNLPREARRMFERRYFQELRKLEKKNRRDRIVWKSEDRDHEYKPPIKENQRKAKSKAKSFIKTRFKKIKGDWHKRKNGSWTKINGT